MKAGSDADPSEARRIRVGDAAGEVGGLWLRPPSARWVYVLAHGAGAGMRHPFMTGLAAALARREVATLRYQFPYMESGARRPDPPALCAATVRAAVAAARAAEPSLPIAAGGKSFGGRMTSQAAAGGLDEARAIVFVGFPLHPPGAPATTRADHLAGVPQPMLFLQGTRDELAELDLLRPICERLGARATLAILEGADHAFTIRKRDGGGREDVRDRLADTIAQWLKAL